jgi:hypothetical protein
LSSRSCTARQRRSRATNERRGFVLRVRAGGSRRFVVEWKRGGRKRRLTLGVYGTVTVDQARELAQQVLARVARGEDPAEERAAEKHAPLVADLTQRSWRSACWRSPEPAGTRS